jgi:hypothetical protein
VVFFYATPYIVDNNCIVTNTVDKWVKTLKYHIKRGCSGFEWVVYWCQWVIVVSKLVTIEKKQKPLQIKNN